jgi:hypothetical protein
LPCGSPICPVQAAPRIKASAARHRAFMRGPISASSAKRVPRGLFGSSGRRGSPRRTECDRTERTALDPFAARAAVRRGSEVSAGGTTACFDGIARTPLLAHDRAWPW